MDVLRRAKVIVVGRTSRCRIRCVRDARAVGKFLEISFRRVAFSKFWLGLQDLGKRL